jgi:mannose-6-phosphate isomerase-like protein (cupin superfamily)
MYLAPIHTDAPPLQTATGEIIFEMIGKAVTASLESGHSLARIVIPPGKSSSTHYHKISQETYFILAGEGRMQVDDKHFSLLPGQACWIESGEVHRIHNEGEVELVFLAICVPAWVPGDSYEV